MMIEESDAIVAGRRVRHLRELLEAITLGKAPLVVSPDSDRARARFFTIRRALLDVIRSASWTRRHRQM